MNTLKENLTDFDTLPVSFLLQGDSAPFHFRIPSFQRGYRWEAKHVTEMLDDILHFVTIEKSYSYFLQPIVVRKVDDHTWEVLDGQQRLTTLLLILEKFMPKDDWGGIQKTYSLYDIQYSERSILNFNDPNPSDSLDSFYLAKAKRTIESWVAKMVENGREQALSEMRAVLYYADCEKKVKFIWYVVQNDQNTEVKPNDLTAIKVFNHLNRGKISLTGSELIKALFVINVKNSSSHLDIERFAVEWDTIEKQFQRDDFWYFISNRKNNIETRIDVLFDFVVGLDSKKDALVTYRKFQEIYDEIAASNNATGLINSEYKSFDDLWRKVNESYDLFIRWYENTRLYNYIGYLIYLGKSPFDIYKDMGMDKELDEDALINNLRKQIIEKLAWKKYAENTGREFDDWEYSNSTDYVNIRKALLLYNIEHYSNSNMRFPFDEFGKGSWDVEHVDSQHDNNMQKVEDKIEWIKLVLDQLQYDSSDKAMELLKKGTNELKTLEDTQEDKDDLFKGYYDAIFEYYNVGSKSIEKDTIDNLALLNCGINRSYQNAPFPYKRSVIIQNDEKGVFVPLCTRNLFLKYYTGAIHGASQLDVIRWSDTDREAYGKNIYKTLKFYLS